MKSLINLVLLNLFFAGSAFGADSIREPAVSGMFYPSSPKELKQYIAGQLKGVSLPEIKGDVLGIIVPHAGYVYSAPVAAWGYKLAEGKAYDTVVLIGVSHRATFDGASVGNFDALRTPLGDVPVDREIAGKLLKNEKLFHFYELADRPEHSLEVQLPFLQCVLKDFRVVPVLIGDFSLETARALAEELVKATEGRKVLFVASTDLSHYHTYEEAVLKDKATVQSIQKMNAEDFCKSVARGESELCGHSAVLTMMLIAGKLNAGEIKLLKYANSGDVPEREKGRVVGYAAMAVIR
jgi:MEMO1 family protein